MEHTEYYEPQPNSWTAVDTTVDPYGAGIGLDNPYPDPADAPNPQDPYGCDMLDPDEQCDEEIEEFQDTDSPSAEAGSPGENTCYIDGVEQPNCDQFAHEMGIHDDIPVTKDNEFPDKAGSDSGPKSMNQNDDPTDDRDPGNFGERTFEQDNNGSFGFEASTVNGSDYLGSVSDLDLRGQTMPNPRPIHFANVQPNGGLQTPVVEDTDCDKLVKITSDIVASAQNATDFANQMAKRFLGVEGATTNQFRRASHIGSREFKASGFKANFRDDSNQVRHFTAGLIAGYLFGGSGGYAAMGLNESYGWGMVEPSDDQTADIALNAVSTGLGARIINPSKERTEERSSGARAEMRRTVKIPAHPGYTDIAERIRNQICE